MKRHMLAATAVVALLFLLTVGAPHASADTFNFTSCHATTGCLPLGTSYGTVTLTQTTATTVLFDVVLTGGSYFVETGAGAGELFLFNATSGMTVNSATATATLNGTNVTGTVGGLTYVFHSAGVHADGTGDFTGSIECTVAANCNGSSGQVLFNDLHFTVANTTVGALETTNTSGNLFVADIAILGNGANTGPVDVTPGTSVPDGGMTLMLLGGALVCVESLRRKFAA